MIPISSLVRARGRALTRAPSSAMSSIANKVTLYYNDVYEVVLPPTHRFPMDKYRLVRQKLQSEFVNDMHVDFVESPLATTDELKLTHCPDYVDRYLAGRLTEAESRKTGFPHNQDNINRARSSAGGTVAATRSLLTNKDALFSGHLAGGTHHAFYDYGEGFCVFSDIAVACNIALKEYPDVVKQILIIDLDVVQRRPPRVYLQHALQGQLLGVASIRLNSTRLNSIRLILTRLNNSPKPTRLSNKVHQRGFEPVSTAICGVGEFWRRFEP